MIIKLSTIEYSGNTQIGGNRSAAIVLNVPSPELDNSPSDQILSGALVGVSQRSDIEIIRDGRIEITAKDLAQTITIAENARLHSLTERSSSFELERSVGGDSENHPQDVSTQIHELALMILHMTEDLAPEGNEDIIGLRRLALTIQVSSQENARLLQILKSLSPKQIVAAVSSALITADGTPFAAISCHTYEIPEVVRPPEMRISQIASQNPLLENLLDLTFAFAANNSGGKLDGHIGLTG